MKKRKNGSATAALEDTMVTFIGAGSAVFLNSGTAAIRLALQLAAEEVYGIPIPVRSGMKEGMADGIADGRDARCPGNCDRSSGIGKGGGEGQAVFSVGKRESIAIGLGLVERRGSGMCPASSLQGRRVFCPDLAPASLALPILQEGGEPIFIDISPCDWCMDPEALEIAFALYPDVRIVLMTHLYGFPGQIREIKEICVRHGAVLIEDASEALGASIGGRMVGSFGDYGILDFGRGKIVSVDAGGMLLLNRESCAIGVGMGKDAIGTGAAGCFEAKGNADVACAIAGAGYGNEIDATACASFRAENASISIAKRAMRLTGLPDPALPRARHGRIGYSYGYARTDFHAMAEPLAKRILSELPHLPERIARKKEIYENYREMLDGDLMYMNPVGAGTEPNYWMPCITCESSIPFQEYRSESGYSYANPHGTSSPMEIHDALRALGIWSCPVCSPLHLHPAFRGCDQVSLGGSKCRYEEGGIAICRDRHEREADNIEITQKAADAANALDRANIADAFAKDASRKTLGGTSAPIISWERYDWSRQISRTGLCLPSGSGMAREEQERVAGIIYACFDAGETGGCWATA